MSGRTPLTLKPADCPKFNTCPAPIRPLNPRWRTAVHLPGEPVCRYLLASGKAGAAEHYAGDPVFPAALGQLAAVCQRHPRTAGDIARSARKGLRKGNPAWQKAAPGVAGQGDPPQGDSDAT
jgi:hypothetical protein